MADKVRSTDRTDEWTPLNPSQGFAWTAPGTTLVGVWMGSTTGEKGPRGVIETDTGDVIRFTLPVSLRQQVGDLDEGTRCKITYTGDRVSRRTHHSYKVFTVLVARQEGQ
jgi:hypothetical protein